MRRVEDKVILQKCWRPGQGKQSEESSVFVEIANHLQNRTASEVYGGIVIVYNAKESGYGNLMLLYLLFLRLSQDLKIFKNCLIL